jgi:hypothetical protein
MRGPMVMTAGHPPGAGGAVPQTAATPFVTRRYSSGPLNVATHSPEDSHGDRKCRSARLQRTRPKGLFQYRSAGVRASSSMSVDHVPWSSEMPSGRGWKPGSRRGQPRCPRRPSAGPAPLRWDMNYPPTNKSRCSTPIHAIGLSTTTARASALVPDPYRVRAACPQRVRWSQCGQSTDRH